MHIQQLTHHEQLKTLFIDFGLEFDEDMIVHTNADGKSLRSHIKEGEKTIVCMEGKHCKVDGYTGFSSEFVFDKDGNFLNLNCWE